jgi:hypothetical protein
MLRRTCGDYARVLYYFAREAAGALGIRHSLRPLLSRDNVLASLGRYSRRGNADLCLKRHCEERRSNPALGVLCDGLLREACHPAALCADRVARNDGGASGSAV